MRIHRFTDDDLRILASLAIDSETDHLFFKVVKVVNRKDNYWSYDCRFSYDERKFDTHYESLMLDCGADNTPETYQMCVTIKSDDLFQIRPITSPLLVVHFFEEMCKKCALSMQ